MTHYSPTITDVPLEQILMTKPISSAIQATGQSAPRGFKGDPRPHGFALSRMHEVLPAMQSGLAIPPIVVKRVATVYGVPYFSIEDGRHRFASSIILGYSMIPAIVQ